jgi:integral membrane sensor domain MASE1
MISIFDCSILQKENLWQQTQHFVESSIFLLHEVGSCKENCTGIGLWLRSWISLGIFAMMKSIPELGIA